MKFTEVETSEAERASHDSQEDLRSASTLEQQIGQDASTKIIHIIPGPSLLPSSGHYPNGPICWQSLPLWMQQYLVFQLLAPLLRT